MRKANIGREMGDTRWETGAQRETDKMAQGEGRSGDGACAQRAKEELQKHVFLRNEPTDLERYFYWKWQIGKALEKKLPGRIGGFVLENEPTGRGF
jgi:hypothetical protein